MKKVIVIVGPTSIGKTKLSVMLAKELGGEIISGDSVAVYKRLDIGSAKVTKEEQDGVKHHLIDVLEPTKQYTVCDFQRQSRDLIDKIDLPIIAGGTGLYVKASLYNYEFNAPKRNDEILKQFESLTNEELYSKVKELDPNVLENIHVNNRKRLLRALEACTCDVSLSESCNKDESLYEHYIIYLNVDRELLYNRINMRVDVMFEHGLEKEVRDLYNDGITVNAIGYKEFIPYFEGSISLDEVKELIKKNSRHLAKRQMTWFRHQMKTNFYEVNLDDINETFNVILNDVKKYLEV